ncbi:MAG: hypothetical protein ACREL1_03050 [bacterium]
MKKKYTLHALAAIFLIGLGLGSQGCNQNQPITTAVLAEPLPVTVVSNFSNASLNVNPTLTNSKRGNFLDGTYGYTTDSGLILSTPPAGDPSDSSYALHLFGTYTDYGNGAYPAFELECFLRDDQSYFDASGFTGIKFDWNCPSDDNSQQRFLCLVTARIAPQSIGGDGTCGTAGAVPCYDYFSLTLPQTGGTWQSITASLMTGFPLQYSSGSPSTVQTTDLQQVLELMWTNRANNIAGNYTCNMWLDNIRFY